MFLLALHSTGWAQACTEASARNRRRAIGVPTMALRPSTTARRPRNSTPYARSSSITPAGVHGTASGCAAPPPPRGGHPAACKPPRPPRDARASRAERGLVCGEGEGNGSKGGARLAAADGEQPRVEGVEAVHVLQTARVRVTRRSSCTRRRAGRARSAGRGRALSCAISSRSAACGAAPELRFRFTFHAVGDG